MRDLLHRCAAKTDRTTDDHRAETEESQQKHQILPEHSSAARIGRKAQTSCLGWICFSGQDWWYHNRAHSDFQLMRRIACSRPVLLVNSIGMRMPLPGRSTKAGRRILRKIKSILQSLQQPLPDTPNFYVFTPFMLPFYGSRIIRTLSAHLVRIQIRMMAKRIGIDPQDAIFFLTVPTALEVVNKLPCRALLYNRSDLHSAFEETDQSYIRKLEHGLFATADAVLYSSHSLMEAEQVHVGTRGFFLDHGVEFDRFTSNVGAEPADLIAIPHPRIGFFGGIDDYVVDLDLIEQLARSIPDASVVLVGDATCSMARFETLSNVYWLGYRPYEEIPAYGRGFDVAIMPWLRNQWIEHSNPIKLKEYLALGLPVVSTDFPEIHHYADVTGISSNSDDFIRLVKAAIAGHAIGNIATRRQKVANATWGKQVERLLAIAEATQH